MSSLSFVFVLFFPPPPSSLSLCIEYKELELGEEIFSFWEKSQGQTMCTELERDDVTKLFFVDILLPCSGHHAAERYAKSITKDSLRDELIQLTTKPVISTDVDENSKKTEPARDLVQPSTLITSRLPKVLQRLLPHSLKIIIALAVILVYLRRRRIVLAARQVVSTVYQTLLMSLALHPHRQ